MCFAMKKKNKKPFYALVRVLGKDEDSALNHHNSSRANEAYVTGV